jgi:hypothetical protein
MLADEMFQTWVFGKLYGMNFYVSPNSYIEALIYGVMVFVDGTFGH